MLWLNIKLGFGFTMHCMHAMFARCENLKPLGSVIKYEIKLILNASFEKKAISNFICDCFFNDQVSNTLHYHKLIQFISWCVAIMATKHQLFFEFVFLQRISQKSLENVISLSHITILVTSISFTKNFFPRNRNRRQLKLTRICEGNTLCPCSPFENCSLPETNSATNNERKKGKRHGATFRLTCTTSSTDSAIASRLPLYSHRMSTSVMQIVYDSRIPIQNLFVSGYILFLLPYLLHIQMGAHRTVHFAGNFGM